MNSASHLYFKGLADMLNDCSIDRIMAIDGDWHIIAWNRTSEVISGMRKSDVMGKHLLQVFPRYEQDKEIMTAIDIAFKGMKSFVPALKEGFNRQHYENHFIPLKETGNQVIGVMNIMHDVSHRIKAEQQLHQLNIALKKKYEQLERATDELATITYITSHNIKEPLRQVYSSLELLIRAEAKALSDGGKANLRRMQASLNRMTLLLDDILALSGIHHPAEQGTPVDLYEMLQKAQTTLHDKLITNNVKIVAGALPTVNGYSELLHYLFIHLISNAIRFRKHDAPLTVMIDSQVVNYPDNTDGHQESKTYIRVSFTDNGTGFNPEDAEQIFLMADKSPHKYASSGAGLAICRKIMIVHDGFIQADGWPGRGAAFHCYFPIAQ